MKRLSFLQKAASGLFGISLTPQLFKNHGLHTFQTPADAFFTMDGNRITYFLENLDKPVKIIFTSDTHLWRDDERGEPYRQYSSRMAKAYNTTTHFRTGESTNPENCFEEVVTYTKESDADLLALVGDLVSWPSEAAIDWTLEKLQESGVSYIYTSGNHDWHYEGLEGSIEDLRAEWIERRLLPFYHGTDPMMASYDVEGIRVITIDNSTYQVSPAQLSFFQEHLREGKPTVLMMHIPMYAPGRSVGYGCGHPKWGASTDRNYELERRPRWPESGHTKTTMDFHDAVFNSSNLLGVFAGHVHRFSMESINGIPQFVSDDNASGGFLEIDFKSIDDA